MKNKGFAIGKGYNPKHQEKVAELVDTLSASLKVEAERLYRCGAIDPGAYNEDEYVLAKILVTAAIHNVGDNFRPLHPEHKKELENLKHF